MGYRKLEQNLARVAKTWVIKMTIYVATFESGTGNGLQKVFKDKKEAKKWLKKQYDDNFDDDALSFKEWCNYGAWTGKIKSFKI